MKTIETKIYAPVEGKPGLVREIGKRKAVEVFQDLEQALRDLYLYPAEYFLLSSTFSDPDTDFPEILGIQCYAQWGGSEGIYLEVDLAATIDGEYKQINFATGKTLDDDSFAFDKMQYTAGVIYKLLMGDHMRSSRYRLEPGNSEENDYMLQCRVQNELREYIKNVLYHGNEPLIENCAGLGLSAMIAAQLPYLALPEDKVKELMDSDNALELLFQLCDSAAEGTFLEIDDIISECKSIKEGIEEKNAV